MCGSSRRLRVSVLFLSSVVFLAAGWRGGACAEESTNYMLTEDALNKTLRALSDLRSQNLLLRVGGGSLQSEIAGLQKQPKAEKIIRKHGLSLREFVLTYKAASQIREAEKARDKWQSVLGDLNATPQAKLEATQKLAESLKSNLFTPEQIALVRRRMPELESLLPNR